MTEIELKAERERKWMLENCTNLSEVSCEISEEDAQATHEMCERFAEEDRKYRASLLRPILT